MFLHKYLTKNTIVSLKLTYALLCSIKYIIHYHMALFLIQHGL